MPEEDGTITRFNESIDTRRLYSLVGQTNNSENVSAVFRNAREILNVNVPIDDPNFNVITERRTERRIGYRPYIRPDISDSPDPDIIRGYNDINTSNYLDVDNFKFTDEQYDFLNDIIHEIIFNGKITLKFISQSLYVVHTYGGCYQSGTMHRKNIALLIKELISNGYSDFVQIINGLNKYSARNKRLTKYILYFVNSKLTTRSVKFDLVKIEWVHAIDNNLLEKIKEKYKVYYSYMYQKELCKYQNDCQIKCQKYYNELKELIISRRSQNNIKTYKKYAKPISKLLKLNGEYYIVYQISQNNINKKMAKIEGLTIDKRKICNSSCSKKIIHPYNQKPKVKFFANDNEEEFYFGIELECISKTKNKKSIINLCNKNKFVQIVKHDGSLSRQYGVEIVTHPMSLEYYEQNFKTFLNELKKIARVNYQCGTHVHFNKSYLGVENIGGTAYLLEKLLRDEIKLLEKFCDRTCGDYCYYNNHKREDCIGKSESKYEFINFLPQDTVEFRLLNGTLDYNKILKTITMLKYVADVAKEDILYEDKKMKVHDFLLCLLKVNINETIW